MHLRPWSAASLCALGCLGLVVATPAAAEPIKCQRAIASGGSRLVRAAAKALDKCEAGVVKGKIAGPCPNTKAARSLARASKKLAKAIDKACGGIDRRCGGNHTAEDEPSALGWPPTCPNFEHGDCTNTINHCGDIATCLACTGTAAAADATGLLYDDLALPSSGTVQTCQLAIGKATTVFLAARSKAVQQCWDARILGKHSDECVPPAVGDGKYLDAIAKAEAKKITAICKACGGPDQTCPTVDDLTPPAIGFPALCPSVTVPGGAACGGPVGDLAGLMACVGCVATFETGCLDRLALPGITTYPSECNVCVAPPPSGPCPTSLEFTADGPAVDLDTGFRGLAHDAKVPTNGRLTLAVSGCAGTDHPTCGECTVNGPFANAGGAVFDNHRCDDATWISCANDADCTNAGAAGPCTFFFGPPLPLVAGGVATCVVNRVAGPVSGTVNIEDGSSSTHVPLASSVHVLPVPPCPLCVAGICDSGARVTKACLVQGTGELGDVSLDCPPSPGANVGALSIDLAVGTNSQSRTVTASNPQCTGGPSVAGLRCQCDTCNNLNEEACATNADCPPSGGNPGICGGRRCRSGANAGAPCASNSVCPGGACTRPGEPTYPNACIDTTATPIDGTLCQDLGGNEGECPEGPIDPHCSVEAFRGCNGHADCNPPPTGSCEGCILGQTCMARNRPCFTDNGIIGSTVSVAGAVDTPCGGVSFPTVGSFFCVAPVGSSSAVNSAAGLPGLGRIRIPGRVSVGP